MPFDTSVAKVGFGNPAIIDFDNDGYYDILYCAENGTLKVLKNDANQRFIDGYTIDAQSGRVIFPVVEPFGDWLRQKIGNDVIADKYCYDELYDSTKITAKQIAEKNKFILKIWMKMVLSHLESSIQKDIHPI